MLSKQSLACVGAVASLLCGTAARADIAYTGLFAGRIFHQTSGNVVTPGEVGMGFLVATQTADEFDTTTVSYPGPNSPDAYVFIPQLMLDGTYHGYVYPPNLPTLADLKAAYPFGRYTFAMSNSTTGASDSAALYFDDYHWPSAMPALTQASYDGLQGVDPTQNAQFRFNSFTGDGFWPWAPVGPEAIDPWAQIAISRNGAYVYVSDRIEASVGAFDLPSNLLDPSVAYGYEVWFGNRLFLDNPDSPSEPGNVLTFFYNTQGNFVTASNAVTHTLVDFEGGTVDNPMALPVVGQTGSLTGHIGGIGDEAYYLFYWSGGFFAANVGLTGADPAAIFKFRLYDDMDVLLEDIQLDASNNWTATMTRTLGVGGYRIGLLSKDPIDPAYTLTFLTPVTGAIPEPGSWALMIAGFGLAGAVLRRSRRAAKVRLAFCA